MQKEQMQAMPSPSASILSNESSDQEFLIIDDILMPNYEQFPDFNLESLLLTSPMGFTVKSYYNKYGVLDNTRRRRLVDIIVKHIYSYIIQKYILMFC